MHLHDNLEHQLYALKVQGKTYVWVVQNGTILAKSTAYKIK